MSVTYAEKSQGAVKQSPSKNTLSMSTQRRREAIAAYLFIAPAFILFLIFVAGPMLWSIGLSFFEWNIFTPPKFVALKNFTTLFNDARVLASFRNSTIFVIAVVALDVVVALGLAALLQRKMPAPLRYFFRTTFLLPVVTSMAAIAIVLSFMFDTQLGVINYYLGQLGIAPVRWLNSSQWALISLIIATIWKTFGFDLILFYAGMQNIPRHYYEAAAIDGANGWQQFRHVTLPQLSPTIFFVVVIGIISHLQMFDQANIMTKGGPGNASTTVVMVIWDSLASLKLGYGSSIATVFFIIILILTLIQFRISRRWVYYEGKED
ncbi:MAG: sugar ABC transporter permease [Anaerolineae bacterium]|nr:sugar ABC transporter permease [Anaerolineae bacterium]